MKKFISLCLTALMLTSLLTACGGAEEKPAEKTDAPAADAAKDIKIGAILLGDENEGYTYAHIEGIEEALKENGLTSDNIIYKYNIPEDVTCYDAATDLVEQGCEIIFANSFGHESFLLQAADENPDVMFCHATGAMAASAGLDNFTNYFTNIYESRYVSGVVAGMKMAELLEAGEITDPYLGYVGAYPYAEVVSGYTAFFLGVKSIVPEAHMDVMYTNSWFDITAEGEAANALIARGANMICQHADSTGAPSAVQTAQDSGKTVYCVGYNIDMQSVAPGAALTSAQNVWSKMYSELIQTQMNGGEFQKDYAYGFNHDAVKISALGEPCAEGTAEKVAEVEEAIKNGELHVFDTSTFTVGGEELTSYDKSFGFEGNELIFDGYFHESELRSAPAFDLRIDGITELS